MSAPGIASAAGPPDSAADSDKAGTDAAAWGLDGASGGLSKETKIGLALIAVLLCAFAFVVYKRIDQSRQHQALAANETQAGTAESDSPEARVPSEAEPKPPQSAPRAAADPFGEVVPVQHEPAYAHEEVAPEPVAVETVATTVHSSVPPTLAFDSEPVEHEEPLLPPGSTDVGSDPFQVADAAPTLPPQSEPSSSDPFATQQQDQASHSAADDPDPAGLLDLFPSDADSGEANPSPQPEPNSGQSAIAVLPELTAEPAAASEQNADGQTFGDPFALSDPAEPQMPAVPELEPEASLAAEHIPDQGEPTEPPLLVDGHPAELMLPTDPAVEDHDAAVVALGPPLMPLDQETMGSEPPRVDSEPEMAGSTTVVHAPDTADARAQTARYAELGAPAFEEPVVSPAVDSGMSAEQTTPEASVDPFDPLAPAPLEMEPQPVPEISVGTSPEDSPTRYEVRPGDSFWMISRRHYGTARYYVALARYNAERIPDPRRMRPGMQVLVPAREVLESRYPDLFPSRTTGRPTYDGARSDLSPGFHLDGAGQPLYRVGSNDTLGAIAQRHLGRSSRWLQIYELNRSAMPDPHALKVGTILKLPADAGRVRTASHIR